MTALLGLNGAGKTTLLRCLMGMTAAALLAFVRKVHRRWDQALVDRYLALFSLPLDRRIGTYSTGMRSMAAGRSS